MGKRREQVSRREHKLMIASACERMKSNMLVGILTVKLNDRGNFRDIIRMGNRMKIPVYVIPIEGFNFESKTCVGYKWNGQWEKTIFPFPTVIYNRILTRKLEQSPEVQELLSEIGKLGIPLFNPGYFDKSVLYRIVGNHPSTFSLLPETEELQSLSHFKQMLETHRQLYAKPVQSYGGKGILRLDQTEDGVLVNSLVKGKQTIENLSVNSLYKRLSKNRKYKKYVLQRSIPLAKVDGHIYDLRILVQKNRIGKWTVTGVGARVAPQSGIVTHVPNGGFIREAEETLFSTFNYNGETILEDVKDNVLTLASVIEEQTLGLLGEMSMDIGIDESGKPWFFEANAKPGKFDEPHIRRLSIQRLLEYCIYLSGKHSNVTYKMNQPTQW